MPTRCLARIESERDSPQIRLRRARGRDFSPGAICPFRAGSAALRGTPVIPSPSGIDRTGVCVSNPSLGPALPDVPGCADSPAPSEIGGCGRRMPQVSSVRCLESALAVPNSSADSSYPVARRAGAREGAAESRGVTHSVGCFPEKPARRKVAHSKPATKGRASPLSLRRRQPHPLVRPELDGDNPARQGGSLAAGPPSPRSILIVMGRSGPRSATAIVGRRLPAGVRAGLSNFTQSFHPARAEPSTRFTAGLPFLEIGRLRAADQLHGARRRRRLGTPERQQVGVRYQPWRPSPPETAGPGASWSRMPPG